MRESSTYQAILREGRAEGRAEALAEDRAKGRIEGFRDGILICGEARFGSIMPVQQTTLDSISDLDRLTRIVRRLPTAASWDDVLSTP